MTNITASQVKALRDRTGLGMMECKKALTETHGNIDDAIDLLRKSSGMKAAKKASRIAAEGVALIKKENSRAVVVEVNCETDFVAKDAHFLAFVDVVLKKAQSDSTATVASLTDAFSDQREQLVQKIGENINIRRVAHLQASVGGSVSSYVHNNKIAVLVALDKDDIELGKNIAMHIAASNPVAIKPEDVDSDILAKEREIYLAQAMESGKPQEIANKMVEGRVRKYLAEVSLTEQPFVRDNDVTVGGLLKSSNNQVTGFCRFEVGEGIEKEQIDFVDEVKQQAGI